MTEFGSAVPELWRLKAEKLVMTASKDGLVFSESSQFLLHIHVAALEFPRVLILEWK